MTDIDSKPCVACEKPTHAINPETNRPRCPKCGGYWQGQCGKCKGWTSVREVPWSGGVLHRCDKCIKNTRWT